MGASSPAITPTSRRKSFPEPTATSEQLFADNQGLARKVAWRWHKRTGIDYADLEQIAMLGLLRGCRKYDPARINPANGKPYAVSTAVMPFSNGEVLHYLRDQPYPIRFPPRWREKWGKVQRLIGERKTLEQISEIVGLPPDEISDMLEAMTNPAELAEEIIGDHGIEEEPDDAHRLLAATRSAMDRMATTDLDMLEVWRKEGGSPPWGPIQQYDRLMQRHARDMRLRMLLPRPLAS